MSREKLESKSLPELEEEILEFWKKNKIFEKSIAQRKDACRFVFYDGPPFATGLPHYGHILGSTAKDMVPRYWTMRGFRVDRRWGWDCHGLPIEHLVEQELKVSGRKAIEKLGLEKFNEAARAKVLLYAAEWKKMVERIGRFVDFDRSYKTMDPSYMESVWWAFATLWRKGLICKDFRIALFCPRCETPLSHFEIAMDDSYREQEDESVYVKFPLEGSRNESLLVWTTTPWTLPGNAAVAVNPQLEYTKFRVGKEYLWAVTLPSFEGKATARAVEKRSGKSLVGLRYAPPFRISSDENAYRVLSADFVQSLEGTGLVHIAPSFGEEDFLVGKRENLPLLQTLDESGLFGNEFRELEWLEGRTTAQANDLIRVRLRDAGILWKIQRVVHRYPICWRCQTPLIYKVHPAWFVNIARLRDRMIALNENIDWHPAHLKHGRFKNGIETAPDWNISRSRFWGTPIPIWECGTCKKITVVGSREEFHRKSVAEGTRHSPNRYLLIRHGEAGSNARNVIASDKEEKYSLTVKGKKQVIAAARHLAKNYKVDVIVFSPFLRTRQSAELMAKTLGIQEIKEDARLGEINTGAFNGRSPAYYHAYFASPEEKFIKPPPGGETLNELRSRSLAFLLDMERRYRGKTILVVGHEYPLWMLAAAAEGLTNEETLALHTGTRAKDFIRFAEIREFAFRAVPRNRTGEADLHRPYVDEIRLWCECGGKLARIPDVFDCWFESGSMPFAQHHYPFEHKVLFEKRFPADFISEYTPQTRGWFYTLHVLSTALFDQAAFRHVVTSGTILSEKGEKLSKSRKNFPDPWLLFGRYGVDAVRFYLMSSPAMAAEDIHFSEKAVDEIYKKYSLIAYNVLNFFQLFRGGTGRRARAGTAVRVTEDSHILDRWILSRLHSTIRTVGEGFERYEIPAATQPLLGFAQDLSLWYVRRSRERMKGEGEQSRNALAVLGYVLDALARLSAPATPFLAELIYRGAGQTPRNSSAGRGKKLSVHLEQWPEYDSRFVDERLEGKMEKIRDIVSRALRLRQESGIKVRQPLARLTIPYGELREKQELLQLIKEEVNVKEISFGGEFGFDTAITPELREEGIVREFVRNVQEMRRDGGFRPNNRIRCQIVGSPAIEAILARWRETAQKEINAVEFTVGGKKKFRVERECEFEGERLWVGIR